MLVFRAKTISARKSDFPIVTWSLIGLNIALYAPTALMPFDNRLELYHTIGLVAANAGFLNMLTSSFLHSDPVHLLTNMLFLYLFGRSMERVLGALEYILIYVGSGIFAAITHLAIVYAFMSPDAAWDPSLGASGAIAGILGMHALRFARHKFQLLGTDVPSALFLLTWLVLQTFLGLLSLYLTNQALRSVNYWAHLGGFMFGMIVAQLKNMMAQGRKEYLLNDAQESLRRGTLLDVIRKYQALLKYDPDDPFAHAELGRTWALLDDAEQAVPYYTAALDLYLKSGKVAEAGERYEEMQGMLSNVTLPADLLYRLGCYLYESDKPSRAVGVLSKISAENAGQDQYESAILKIAEVQLKGLVRPDLAAVTLERFLQEHPDSRHQETAMEMLQSAIAQKT